MRKNEWKRVDDAIRPEIKKTLCLPVRASNNYIYGETSKGLFGVPEATIDNDIAHIDGAYKLLTSNDQTVQDIAWSELFEFVSVCIRKEPYISDVADYLSTTAFEETSNQTGSVWSRAKMASRASAGT